MGLLKVITVFSMALTSYAGSRLGRICRNRRVSFAAQVAQTIRAGSNGLRGFGMCTGNTKVSKLFVGKTATRETDINDGVCGARRDCF